jgi:hypothetical protein
VTVSVAKAIPYFKDIKNVTVSAAKAIPYFKDIKKMCLLEYLEWNYEMKQFV